MVTTHLSATYDDFVPYTGDTGKLNGDVAELKAKSVKKDDVVNNQTTTVEGFALDARQANPNINGTLAKQISDLNRSLDTEFLKNNGLSQFFNPASDLNKFYTGIALFDGVNASNLPTKNWYLVISGGVEDTRVQVAWDLQYGSMYFRNVNNGVIGAWVKKL